MDAIGRRTLLTAMAGAFAGQLLPRYADAAAGPEGELFVSAMMEGERYGILILDGDGTVQKRIDLPGRGHDVSVDTEGRMVVAFARRPGTFALAYDRLRDSEPVVFSCPPDRHFYGHGVFTPDNRLLIATENDYEAGRGVLGLYDPRDRFRRIGEWSAHGIAPHDLGLSPDGRTLIVANGGTDTHPDYGRQILNLAMMEPSVVFLDSASGDLVEKHDLPAQWSRQSTRHMDIAADGRVFVGCQWQGSAAECPPLLLSFAKGEAMRPVPLGDDLEAAFNGYVGSVATNREAGLVALSSPQGDVAAIVEAASGRVVGTHRLEDVCGVSAARDGFLLSTGTGLFGKTELPGIAFDNHILRL